MVDSKNEPERFPAAMMAAIGFEAAVHLDTAAGAAVVRYVARAEHTHSGGKVVQGGFVTAWLDNSMAFAVYARDRETSLATLDLNVSFLERVGQGPVIARARVLRWGGRVAFLEAELHAAGPDGQPDLSRTLARATSTVMLLRRT